jgi:hypothetical protein
VTTTTVLEDDVDSGGTDSVVAAMKDSVVERLYSIDSVDGSDMLVRVEEDLRKSARKVKNINRMRNQGLEEMKKTINTEYGDIE